MVTKVLIGDKSVLNKRDSIRWRDLITSDNFVFLSYNRSAGVVICRIGNGKRTSFWNSRWHGLQPLKEAYQELFLQATDPCSLVARGGS